MTLAQVCWPMESLGDALLTLAKSARLPHQAEPLVVPRHVTTSNPHRACPGGSLASALPQSPEGPSRATHDEAGCAKANEPPGQARWGGTQEAAVEGRDDLPHELNHWLEAAAERIGLEVEAVNTPYSDIDAMLRKAGPTLLVLASAERGARSAEQDAKDSSLTPHSEFRAPHSNVLVVLSSTKRHLRVVAPDLSMRTVSLDDVRAAMCEQVEAPHRQPIETLLTEVELTGRAKESARHALMSKRLADSPIGGCWLLRAPGRREVRWGYWLTLMIGTHVIEQTCSLSAWSLLGWMTFSGRLDGGWLLAWGLLLACVVPFRVFSLAAGSQLSLEFSASLRRRLLAGALRLDPDRVRVEGTGGLLGRVMEAETLEQLALGGGLQSVLSLVELCLAATVLGSAGSQWGGAALLLTFVALAAWLTFVNARRREAWTDARLGLTNNQVERMVGHRTTLAQETREQAAAETDQSLDRYLDPSTKLDRSTMRLQSLLPRAWLLCGLIWLVPSFVSGGESVTRLAVSLGGLLLARQALQKLAEGLDRIAGAAVAWNRLRPFLAKPLNPDPIGDPAFATNPHRACPGGSLASALPPLTEGVLDSVTSSKLPPQSPEFMEPRPSGSGASENTQPLPDGRGSTGSLPHRVTSDLQLAARDVTFRHASRSEPVLSGVDLEIHRGDRVLLEGPSGGGKSTLAALLAGARTPQAGVLLLSGLDRNTLGTAWRRRVVLAPQFHHNHVLMGTFLYNLLLGRAWPPSQADAEEAERLCRQLDLGPLIDRMPGGLLQMVGETGWQLSHGEKSRLFLARALLQRADIVLLDETFSALDPETLSRTLPKVLDLAPTLVVIAHP